MAKSKSQDVLSLIEADHRKVEELFAQMEKAKGKKLQECFQQIYKELMLHAYAEELVFYPSMQEYEETAEYIEEAEEEHNSVKILLEQMKDLSPTDEEFKTKMQHLKESVTHHVQEEESEIFEAVRDAMDDQELKDMAEEFEQAKSRMMDEVEMALTQK